MNGVIHFMNYGMTACNKPGVPKSWPKDHLWSGTWDEVNCPDCLKGREPIETFTISTKGDAITCKRCNRTSHSRKDVEQHYCGYCRVYHDDLWPPARRWWIDNPDNNLKIVVCGCGYRLGVLSSHVEEIKAGVWGTIPCPGCRTVLNEKIKELV